MVLTCTQSQKVNVFRFDPGTKTNIQTLEKKKTCNPILKGTQSKYSIKYTRTRLAQQEVIGEEIYILQYKVKYPSINDPKNFRTSAKDENETN